MTPENSGLAPEFFLCDECAIKRHPDLASARKKEPTLAEMHKHYAEALRVINSQRIQIEGLRSAVLVYLRDLRRGCSDLGREVYLSKSEIALLDATIAALEKPTQGVYNPANNPE
jgi:hypothetical protein